MKIYQIKEDSFQYGFDDNEQDLDFLIQLPDYTSQKRKGRIENNRYYVVRDYQRALNLVYKDIE